MPKRVDEAFGDLHTFRQGFDDGVLLTGYIHADVLEQQPFVDDAPDILQLCVLLDLVVGGGVGLGGQETDGLAEQETGLDQGEGRVRWPVVVFPAIGALRVLRVGFDADQVAVLVALAPDLPSGGRE